MKVLLDTCVLSECYRPTGLETVKSFVNGLPDAALHISVITIGELSKGIDLLPSGKKKIALSSWLATTQDIFTDRIMSIDSETALIWGGITSKLQKQGLVLPIADGLIAATALRHGLHLVTRNVKDFSETGVMLVDPWTEKSS